MKTLSKVLVLVLVLAMALTLVPALETPAEAATTVVLKLSATTAVNPILDHTLSKDLFGTGGPFTLSFEWKCNIKDNVASDPNSQKAFVQVVGTINESPYTTSQDNATYAEIKGTTDWTKGSVQFKNVFTYPMPDGPHPGNILRFAMWHARGDLFIRNLKITDAAGNVKYDLNTDSVVQQLANNMIANGETENDLSNLAQIDFQNCPWVTGSFGTGAYSGALLVDSNGAATTTASSLVIGGNTTKPTTQPTTQPTTKPTTQPTTKPVDNNTTKPTTKPTTRPTTKPTQPGAQDPCADGTHDFIDGWCADCGVADPTYNRCEAKGHEYENNYCVWCGQQDPNYVAPTQPTQPSQPVQNNQGGIAVNPVVLVAFVLILVAGLCLVVLFATGALGGKKKK